MSKLHEHLHKDTFEWRMRADEKDALRSALYAHIEANPLGGMKSPYSWVSFIEARRLVLVPVLILLLGSGTAYAAQGALPGDTLYPIKIHVNEAVAGTLAISDVAKASYNADVAAERLKEAQALAAQNKLDATTTQELAANYDAHAALASQYADKVQSDDPAQGAELHASLASIQAEGDVLAAVAARDGSDETKQNADDLASRARGIIASANGGPVSAALAVAPKVQMFAAKTMMAPVQNGGATATDTEVRAESARSNSHDQDERNVRQLRVEVMNSFATLKAAVARTGNTVDASTSAELDLRLQSLSDMIDTAKQSNAVADYQSALSAAAVLRTFIAAQLKFNGNILAPLLKIQIPFGGNEEGLQPRRHGDEDATSTSSMTPAATSSAALSSGDQSSSGAVEGNGETDVHADADTPAPPESAVQHIITTVQNGLHL